MFEAIMIVACILLGLRLCVLASCAGIAAILLNENKLIKLFDTGMSYIK